MPRARRSAVCGRLDRERARQESNATVSPDDVGPLQNQDFAAKRILRNDGQAAAAVAKSRAQSDGFTRTDPNLQRLIDAWPTLPEPIHRAILALIGTALPETPGTPLEFAE
jgi:hypothetical protein